MCMPGGGGAVEAVARARVKIIEVSSRRGPRSRRERVVCVVDDAGAANALSSNVHLSGGSGGGRGLMNSAQSAD